MDALVTIPEEGSLLITRATSFPVDVKGVRISTPEESQAAVDQCRQIKVLAAEIEEHRKSLTKPLDDQKKAIMDAYRPATEFLAKCEVALKGSITAFNQEQARIAAEALKEQQRLQQLERDRQAALAPKAEALLLQAEEAAASGDTTTAEALEEQALALQESAAPIATYMPPVVTKTKGASSRTIWKCKVVDPSKLDRAYLMPNQVVLDALAATAKGIGAAPAGCEWISSDSLSIR